MLILSIVKSKTKYNQRRIHMADKDYGLNDIVEMKKEHPCHKSKHWRVIRMGADIRIKCLGCGTSVLFPRVEFEKKLKRVIEHAPKESDA